MDDIRKSGGPHYLKAFPVYSDLLIVNAAKRLNKKIIVFTIYFLTIPAC